MFLWTRECNFYDPAEIFLPKIQKFSSHSPRMMKRFILFSKKKYIFPQKVPQDTWNAVSTTLSKYFWFVCEGLGFLLKKNRLFSKSVKIPKLVWNAYQ